MSEEIKHYTGETLTYAEELPDPLIEGYLWPDDLIMLLGTEKAGKSIVALQMAACLSSGSLFLEKYKCKKTPVAYLQTEGKQDETAFRIQHMMNAIDFDKNYFHRLYKKFLPLDIPEYMSGLDKLIQVLNPRPKVLIVDALYTSMAGDLNDNKDMRAFLFSYARLSERYSLTTILVHHAKREEFFEGQKVEKGDKVSYGSVFLRANVDHIIFLEMQRDKTRTLSCQTQRSGKVAEKEDLILIQPNPLYFEIKGDYKAYEEIVLANYKLQPDTRSGVVKRTSLSESSVKQATLHLLRDKKIKEFVQNSERFYSII